MLKLVESLSNSTHVFHISCVLNTWYIHVPLSGFDVDGMPAVFNTIVVLNQDCEQLVQTNLNARGLPLQAGTPG